MRTSTWSLRRLVSLLVAFGVVAAACASATEYGDGQAASDDATPAVASTPDEEPAAPTVAPTAATEPEAAEGEDTSPVPEPAGEQIGAADVNTGDPETLMIPALRSVGDAGAVIYDAAAGEREIVFLDGRSPIRGFTPDGRKGWARVPTSSVSCPKNSFGTRLHVVDGETGAVEPVDEQNDTLLEIAKIHQGPNGHVLLEHSCGKYGGPAALAQMDAEGALTNFQAITNLDSHLWMWEPRWGWSEDGELLVVIPTNGNRKTAIDNYVLVETGEVIEKVATDTVGSVYLAGLHEVQIVARTDGGEGRRILLNGEPIWDGVIWEYAHDGRQLAAVGPNGGVWVRATRAWDDPNITRLDGNLSSVALSPNGHVIALAGDTGTGFIGQSGEVTSLHDAGGRDLAFSSDGLQLSVTQLITDEFQSPTPVARIWEFEQAATDPAVIDAGTVVSSAGLGPIRVGMTITDIESATGQSFTIESIGTLGAGECFWGYIDDLFGVTVIGEAQSANPDDGIVMAVSVTSPLYPTPSGVRIGDATDKVLRLFPGQIDISPHTYSNGSYLDYLPVDEGEQTSVRFETMPGGQVSEIRGGIIGWTRLVEGCA